MAEVKRELKDKVILLAIAAISTFNPPYSNALAKHSSITLFLLYRHLNHGVLPRMCKDDYCCRSSS